VGLLEQPLWQEVQELLDQQQMVLERLLILTLFKEEVLELT
jgi:hypothetical protein